MPRLRIQSVDSGAVPNELIDPLNEVWESKQSALQFLKKLRLDTGTTAERLMTYVPDTAENRHQFVSGQWALANGMTRELSSGRHLADWVKLREAGVPVIQTARIRLSRLKGTY